MTKPRMILWFIHLHRAWRGRTEHGFVEKLSLINTGTLYCRQDLDRSQGFVRQYAIHQERLASLG